MIIPDFFVLIPVFLFVTLLFFKIQLKYVALIVALAGFDQIGGLYYGFKFSFLKVGLILSSIYMLALIVKGGVFVDKLNYSAVKILFFVFMLLIFNTIFYGVLFNDYAGIAKSFFVVYQLFGVIVLCAVIINKIKRNEAQLMVLILEVFGVLCVLLFIYEGLSLFGFVPQIATKSVNQLLAGTDVGVVAAFEIGESSIYRFKGLTNEPKMYASIINVFLVVLYFCRDFRLISSRKFFGLFLIYFISLAATYSTSGIITCIFILALYFGHNALSSAFRKNYKRSIIIAFFFSFLVLASSYLLFSEPQIRELFLHRVWYRIFGHPYLDSAAYSGPLMLSETVVLQSILSNFIFFLFGFSYIGFFEVARLNSLVDYAVPNIGLIYWFGWGGVLGLSLIVLVFLKSSVPKYISFSYLFIIFSFAHIETIFYIVIFMILIGRSYNEIKYRRR